MLDSRFHSIWMVFVLFIHNGVLRLINWTRMHYMFVYLFRIRFLVMRSRVYPVEAIMTYQLLLSDLTLLPHPFNGVTGKDFQGDYLFSCDN